MLLFVREKRKEKKNKDSGGDVPMDWLVIRCEAYSLDREPSRAWWQGYGLTCKCPTPPPPRRILYRLLLSHFMRITHTQPPLCNG